MCNRSIQYVFLNDLIFQLFNIFIYQVKCYIESNVCMLREFKLIKSNLNWTFSVYEIRTNSLPFPLLLKGRIYSFF